MKEGQASRTAEFMALFRALESVRPASERLFADPYAASFLRPALRLVVRMSRLPGAGALVAWFIDERWPGARSSAVARTRFIDERLGAALEAGIAQVVLLGAGFDCRAYRLPGLHGATVFEVDHPRTLARKRESLARVFRTPPAHVRFVATDFDRDDVASKLAEGGYQASRPCAFLWEGVTNYLSAAAIDRTLRWMGRAAPGSLTVFTYVERGVLDDPSRFSGTGRLFRSLERMGEPWTFGFDPAEVGGVLAARGLERIEDLGADEYRALYGRNRGKPGYAFYRIVVARAGVRAAAAAPRA